MPERKSDSDPSPRSTCDRDSSHFAVSSGVLSESHDVDQRLAALGGGEGLAAAADVLRLDQLLDHAGAGGWRSQAARVHRIVLDGSLQLAVLDGPAGVLHGRQQRRVRVGLRRGRLAVLHANVAIGDGEGVALLDVGGDVLRLVVLVLGGLAAARNASRHASSTAIQEASVTVLPEAV